MKKSTKAILLSALVFPGLGHFYLKKYIQGTVLVLIAAVSIYVLTSMAIHTALDVANNIESGKVALDVAAIDADLNAQTAGAGQIMNIATYVFTLSWLVAMIDCYRIARKQVAN